jgi:hypothetical protein
MTTTLVDQVVTLTVKWLFREEKLCTSSSDAVVNTALMSVVMEDTLEEDTEPVVTPQEVELVDSSVSLLLTLNKAEKSFFVLDPVVAVATNTVVLAEEKKAEKAKETVVSQELKVLVVLEPKASMELNSKAVTVIQEEHKPQMRKTVAAVEPVTSEAKVVAQTPEEEAVAQATVILISLTTVS